MLDKNKLKEYDTYQWKALFHALGIEEVSFKGYSPLNLNVRTTKENRVDTYLKIIAGMSGRTDKEVEDMAALLNIN